MTQRTHKWIAKHRAAWLPVAWLMVLPAQADELFDLSLEELATIRVVVASKQQERLADAPGSVTSYSHTDIQRLGYYNLADLANITPGYATYTSIGENTLVTRGQKASGFDNNRHLLLLDGIPINHVRAYSVQADHHFPLFFAKQVDFLRGPASALYGVSAFYGVIAVDPLEQTREGQQFTVRASAGDNDGEQRVLANYLMKNAVGTGGMRVGYYQKDASEAIVADDPAHRNYDDQESLFLYGSWQWDDGMLEGLRFGGLYLQKEGGLGDFWADYSSEMNDIEWESAVLYAKYQRDLSAVLQLRSYLKYAYGSEASTFYDQTETVYSHYDYPFHSYEGQAELDWSLGEASNLIVGVNYDTRYGESEWVVAADTPRLTPRTPDVDTTSFYAQYKNTLPLLNGTLITLGLREDRGEAGEDAYSKLSPRLAVVQRFNPIFNLKLMYGEALRGPSVKELGVNDEVRVENPGIALADLEPEDIETLEIAPYLQTQHWLLSLTYYETETARYLGRDWSNLGEYVNSDQGVDVTGWELDVQYQLADGSKWFFNGAQADARFDNGDAVSDVPDLQLNAGWMWGAVAGLPLSGSVVLRWVDAYVAEHNPEPDGNTQLDLNLNYRLAPEWVAGLQVRNVLDDDGALPLGEVPHLPLPGRSVLLSVQYQVESPTP